MDQQNIRILYIEDDEDDYLIVRNLLSRIKEHSSTLVWKADFDSGLLELKKNAFDLCLLDYHIGNRTGFEFLEQMRLQRHELPVIFLTGHTSREIDMGAMQKGAINYLSKTELNPESLERAIRYAVSYFNSEQQRQELKTLLTTKELAAAVAHEFSQPLQVLKLYFGMMKEGIQKPEFIEKGYEQIIRLEGLTDHLRNITGIRKKEYLDEKIIDLVYSNSKERNLEKGARILIVDDESDVLETLIEIFNLNGFVCDGAHDGIEALEQFGKHTYQLIISDIMMPNMHGPDLFAKVKKLGYQGLFVFITGFEVSKEFEAIMQKADAVLNKPVSYLSFLEKVEQLSKR